MMLPFTAADFFEVFRRYNEAMWPAQLVLNAAAIGAVVALIRGARSSGRFVSAILTGLWAWMALAYHIAFFLPVNPAAGVFGAAFMLAAFAFAWQGAIRGRLRFECVATARCAAGFALIAYALLFYPALSLLLRPDALAMPSFGLPCPTTIFTIGVLAFLRTPFPRHVLAVPVLWSFVGLQAAWRFGVYEDFALLAAAGMGIWRALESRPHRKMA